MFRYVLILSHIGTGRLPDMIESDDLFLIQYFFKYIWSKVDQNKLNCLHFVWKFSSNIEDKTG